MNTTENRTPAIALIGYGRMGREIEQAAMSRGMTINAIVDIRSSGHVHAMERGLLEGADVCIEFTVPDAVVDNIRTLAGFGKNIVVGTTGWHHRMDEVRAIVEERNIGLIYGSNFSIGVHLFLALVREAGRLMHPHRQYDAAVSETHHRLKIDAPSGTAISTADALLSTLTRKTRWSASLEAGPLPEDVLHVSAARVGSVPGQHAVLFDSLADSITITHTARSRRGFAEGALLAAEWIQGRKGLYSIEDMINER